MAAACGAPPPLRSARHCTLQPYADAGAVQELRGCRMHACWVVSLLTGVISLATHDRGPSPVGEISSRTSDRKYIFH
eukprot:6211810-Pleurochrysis_carterae.AAC.1